LGVGFDPVTPEQALARVVDLSERGEGGYVVTPNPEIVYACREDDKLRALVDGAALVVADGIGVIHAARILKTPLPARVPGIELGEQFLSYLAGKNKRLYLLGAKPGVAEKAAAELQRRYPGLVIAGTRDGYYKDEAEAAEALRAAAPDAAFVCMGFPRQERFMAAHAAEVPGCVLFGLGGSLDVFAGEVRRAPRIFIRLGMEWFYRLLREPRRIGRMMKLPAFLWLALRERVRGTGREN
jgi:N-acetylglucosaminyldiphosphoundecaprenol N-acetyl-beta-D-mannosaminyltransferase